MWNIFILGNTPLLLAAKNGHEDIVHLLIQNGTDINVKNEKGKFSIFILLQFIFAWRKEPNFMSLRKLIQHLHNSNFTVWNKYDWYLKSNIKIREG